MNGRSGGGFLFAQEARSPGHSGHLVDLHSRWESLRWSGTLCESLSSDTLNESLFQPRTLNESTLNWSAPPPGPLSTNCHRSSCASPFSSFPAISADVLTAQQPSGRNRLSSFRILFSRDELQFQRNFIFCYSECPPCSPAPNRSCCEPAPL